MVVVVVVVVVSSSFGLVRWLWWEALLSSRVWVFVSRNERTIRMVDATKRPAEKGQIRGPEPIVDLWIPRVSTRDVIAPPHDSSVMQQSLTSQANVSQYHNKQYRNEKKETIR
jgi:hypothetical protein